ncbi:RloB family protein [Marinactinospora rubrisoli]|uniref:RloB family protein n=1 Tax=Marinactinospora rubrisoli TaxID=2715399 RepID=A0ABW2K8M7_9ACTN
MLLVCEGETEVEYLTGLRRRGQIVDVRKASKRDAMGIVREAITRGSGDYTHIWAVFDSDNRDVSDASTVARKASTERQIINTAVSQPSFEVWLLLHFSEDVRGCHTPGDARRLLQKAAPNWDKGQWTRTKRKGTRFTDFEHGVKAACERAERLGPVTPGGGPATDVWRIFRSDEFRLV